MDSAGVDTSADAFREAVGSTAGPPARREQWELAATLLDEYLDAVATALAALGLAVTAVRAGDGPDLEAHLDVVPTGVPAVLGLMWAEDTGWSVRHRRSGAPATAWRYLHIDLAPAPATVARFVAANLADAEYVGMPYPAQFRLRGHPRHEVINALSRHTRPAG